MIYCKESMHPMKGIFVFRVLDKNKKIILNVTEPNMIVNTAKDAMARLVSYGDTDKIITKFGVGNNLETAVPSDTTLSHPYINNIVNHTFPEPGTVTFQWYLDYDEAVGIYVSEFGLLTTDGTLFSRKVRDPILKTDDIAFEGEWSIIF